MSEETGKNKPSENGSQRSGNNRHRYNKHRSGHHKPSNQPAADNAPQAEKQVAPQPEKQNQRQAEKATQNQGEKRHHNDGGKGQQSNQKNRPPKNESRKNQVEKNTAQQPSRDPSAERKENSQQKNPSSGNRHGNQPKQPLGSSAPTLFDTAPEDDLIFGKQSSTQKKLKTTPSFTAEELDEVRRFTDEELFGTSHLYNAPVTDNEESAEVVSIKFKKSGKAYYFSPAGHKFSVHDFAIVDTARGPEFGEVSEANRLISMQNIIQPLRTVIRPATKEDVAKNELNKKREKDAFGICLQKIAAHKLDMKLVDVQIAFDNSKILFYFTSAGRVDFRELVRDLASVFKTRIELRQIGIRDEAKMLGGIGICGRPLCCSKFLGNFAQVSIKMAKEQGLSLNSGKISGNCGRLMCCLNFENQTYLDEIKLTPMPGSIVKLDGQTGTVTEATPLIGMLKVHLHNAPDGETVTVHRDSVSVIEKKSAETEENRSAEE